MIKEAIVQLMRKKDLSPAVVRAVFKEIFDKQVLPEQVAAFLTALAFKGETGPEIAAAAGVVREYARKVDVRTNLLGVADMREPVFDSCGTGGSATGKFNISTAVAFVVAAAGVKVAKHGNRAMSSKCGSADCFEGLGIRIDVAPALMQEAVKTVGIGFLFAPLYHPALKDVAVLRRNIGIRTIFNILGPLSNPAGASHQLLGVYRRDLLPVMARALADLGIKRALVAYSADLKDEVSLGARTDAIEVKGKSLKKLSLSAASFGLKRVPLAALKAKDAAQSVKTIKDVFTGRKTPARGIILANAACALYLLGRAASFKEGAGLAAGIIDAGKAMAKVEELRRFLRGK